jgi:hypothetical protein
MHRCLRFSITHDWGGVGVNTSGEFGFGRPDDFDFGRLDDTALLIVREQMRAELELLAPNSLGHARLSARYDVSTAEINERARAAWARDMRMLPLAGRARVQVLCRVRQFWKFATP